MIICYTVHEIWCMTGVIIFHFLKLNSFKLEFKEELHKTKKTIDDVENSQEQLAAEYEKQKGKIKGLMNDNKKLFR